ncbi:MAG: DUF3267 domain-containing protein [Halobacteriales archaeon]
MVCPPPSPDGLGETRRMERPQWWLELGGVVVLVGLGLATGLDRRILAASDEATLALVPAILVVAAIHEACHYLASRALGFDPVVDVVPPRVYAPGQWGTRREAMVALLAPVAVVTVIGLVAWAAPLGPTAALLGHAAVVLNLAMAGGDLYAAGVVARLPAGSRTIVIETDDGPVEFVAEPMRR